MKLFVKKPGEMQSILGKLLKGMVENENEDNDVKERALFYYGAL